MCNGGFVRLIFLLGILAAGCAQRFPLPMTAAECVAYRSGPALVAYLGQPDASPTVCDMHARGPHLAQLDDTMLTSLAGAAADGGIAPNLWRRCTNALLRSAPTAAAATLLGDVGRVYRRLIKSRDVEKLPDIQDRLRVLNQLYIERKNGIDGAPEVLDGLFLELRRALATHRLGPAAARFGDDLVATVDLEHGQWLGRPVDVATIDQLFAAGDERALRRFVDRLPSPALRDEARHRVIRLHIAASPYPEVRANAAAVEEIVAQEGTYALSLAEHAPVQGWLDETKIPMRGVLVRQQVWRQTATLLGYSGDRPGVSVLPEVKLRGALMIEVAGIASPVALCGNGRKLDTDPCVPVGEVAIDNPVAYLDKGGAFHFVDHLAMGDAAALAEMRDRFVLPVSVAGTRLLEFEWWLYYERPEDLVFTGPATGSDGPPLGVRLDHRDPERFIVTVSGPGGPFVAVVERRDAAAFHVSSRGAQGWQGSAGSSGSAGSNVSECGNGGDGGPGGPGGDGGPGGNGGDVLVEVACGERPCTDDAALVRAMIVSEAGAGGAGGTGGAGGPGGAGGSGRSQTTHTDSDGNTVVDDAGCSAGSSGASGSSGPDGASGAPGRPGQVRFTFVP